MGETKESERARGGERLCEREGGERYRGEIVIFGVKRNRVELIKMERLPRFTK